MENKDVGFVNAGQDAEIKLETFPFTRYGTVPATVSRVSADAMNDEKRGACVQYGAVNSRLFDSAVLSDPDRVYEKIKNHADPGFCDYSFIGIQEAATGKR